ncbi:hypothetical protein RSOLAG1IB_12145 [Rhizoctonia solani AG-1 IB]|nr:hypothetical protein RSOLAG1IB_12145 [Rhizoctonia solani AG-1 IB]
MFPAPSNEGKTVDVITLMDDLKVKVDGHVNAMAEVKTAVDLDIKIKALVTDIKAMIAIMVGAKVHLNDDAKLKLAIAVHAMIIAIVKVCATVVAKLGVSACAAIMASLDVTIHSLLLTLNVVVNGFLGVLIGLFVNVDATVAAAIKTCGLSLLAKVLLGLNVTIN